MSSAQKGHFVKRIFSEALAVHRRWTVATVCAGLLVGFSTTTLAQPASDGEAEARQHFDQGQAHYERGEFADAGREFEASYAAEPRASLLYNAYLAYRDLQDIANATRTLRQYLVEAADLDATRRGQLRRRLEALESALAEDAAMPTSQEADPPIEPNVDESHIGPSDESHVGPRDESTVAPAEGLSPVGFIVAGAGLALGIGAVVTGVLSNSDYDELSEQCKNGPCPDTEELRNTQSRGAALATTTDILWVTGLAALIAGVVLIFALRTDASSLSSAVGGTCTVEGCVGTLQGSF